MRRVNDREYLRPLRECRGVNGAFSRVFRSGTPADNTTATGRAMDDSVQECPPARASSQRTTSPSTPHVKTLLSEASLDVLADEFAQQATEHASNNDFLLGPASIEFAADSPKPAP